MNSRKFILSLAASILLCFQAFAGAPYSYKGSTVSKVIGKEETCDNLILSVKETSEGLDVFLKDYSVMGKKDISISGIIKVNQKGEVTGYDKVVVKGIPAKVKGLTGVITSEKADLVLTGKACGTFNFDIHYTAKINK